MSIVKKIPDYKSYPVIDGQIVSLENAIIGNKRPGLISVILDNNEVLAFKEQEQIQRPITIGVGSAIKGKQLMISADILISSSDLGGISNKAIFSYKLQGGSRVLNETLERDIQDGEDLVTFEIKIDFT